MRLPSFSYCITLLFGMLVFQAHTAEAGWWRNIGEFFHQPKLDQFTNRKCQDNSGGNVPIIHAAPVWRKCYNIDPYTESFKWRLGRRNHMYMYSDVGCKGYVVHHGKGDNGKKDEPHGQGCQNTDPEWSHRYPRVRSVMFH